MPVEQNSAQEIGVVTGISGDAYAESAEGMRPLEPGSPIYQGEELVTGDDSNIEVRFADDTLISQGQNSRIALDEYVYEPDSSTSSFLGEIAQGTFRTVTGKIASENPDRFKLGSPLATIGIRGTIILSEVGPDGEKHGVEEIHAGRAMLLQSRATGQIRQLFSGQMSDISGSGVLSPVRPLSTQELNSFREIAPANIRQEQDIRAQEEDQPDDDQNDEQSPDDQGNPDDQNAPDTPPEDLGDDVDPGGGDPDEAPGAQDGILHPGNGILDPGDGGLVGQEKFDPNKINEPPKVDTRHEVGEGDAPQGQEEPGQEEPSGELEGDEAGVIGGDPKPVETDTETELNAETGSKDKDTGEATDSSQGSGEPTSDDDTDSTEDGDSSGSSDDSSSESSKYNTITGTDGQPNTLTGTSGADQIIGKEMADDISGKGGDDFLLGNCGNDKISGDDGNDSILGGAGNDTIFGNAGDDNIDGGTGADTITGGTGDDYIDGGTSTGDVDYVSYADAEAGVTVNLAAGTATGGSGHDTIKNIEGIIGSGHLDNLTGDSDDNVFRPGLNDNYIEGDDATRELVVGGSEQAGDTLDFSNITKSVYIDLNGNGDTHIEADEAIIYQGTLLDSANINVVKFSSIEKFIGSQGDDLMFAGGGSATFDGSGGNDDINGSLSSDSLLGGDGNDIIHGYTGPDFLLGGDGEDIIYGGKDIDYIDGGAGSDWVDFSDSGLASTGVYIGSELTETIDGIDYTVVMEADGTLSPTATKVDYIVNIENFSGTDNGDYIKGNSADNIIHGQDGADSLMGGDGDDILNGGAGDDILHGGEGADEMNGGDNIDLISYKGSSAAISIDLGNGSTSDAAGGTATLTHNEGADIFSNIEGVIGSDVADTIKASTLSADTIQGGKGADTITLTSSETTLTYIGLNEGGDTINNFSHCCDKFLFQGSDFESTASSQLETITSSDGYDGSTDVSYNDACFVFDTHTKSLYYDANGSGAGESTLIATFDSNPNLDAGDINVNGH